MSVLFLKEKFEMELFQTETTTLEKVILQKAAAAQRPLTAPLSSSLSAIWTVTCVTSDGIVLKWRVAEGFALRKNGSGWEKRCGKLVCFFTFDWRGASFIP